MSPARFVQVAVANTLLLWLIVGSGAAVRLTDSGLGCRAWPGCERGRPLPEKDIHAFVEFGNRLVGGVVITLALVTWLAARRAPGLPAWARRVALFVFLGALAQAPIGYLAVATDLRWPVVMTHLLLSFALLAGAVVVTVEAFGLRDGRSPPVVPPELRRLALVFVGTGLALVVSGTFATAAGPHSGGGEHIDRFGSLEPTVYVHGAIVGAFLLSFLFAIGYLAAYRQRSPRLFRFARRRARAPADPDGRRRAPVADGASVGDRSRPRHARRSRLGLHGRPRRPVLPATAVHGSGQRLDCEHG